MATMIFYVMATTMFLAICSVYCARSRLQYAYATPAGDITLIATNGPDECDGRKTCTSSPGDGECREDLSRSIRCPPGADAVFMRCGAASQVVEPLHAPSWPHYLRSDPIWMASDRPSPKDSHDLYSRVYDACESAGSFHQAVKVKEGFLRSTIGGKKVIERAFRRATKAMRSKAPGFNEVLTRKVDGDVVDDFAATFMEVDDEKTGEELRQSLKAELPAEAGLIDLAFAKVFAT